MRITFTLPPPDDAVFAPGALDSLVGTTTRVEGQPALIVAARVREDGMGEVTVEAETQILNLPASLPASYSFRPAPELPEEGR